MTQFVRRRRLRAHASTAITFVYVIAALVLGAGSRTLGEWLGHGTSPISSASVIAILSSIASGMMALTAIVFSLLMVAFQLGHTSYSPRLLQVFRDDNFLGHAIGVFAGTFVYSLLAIRFVDLRGAQGVGVTTVTMALTWLLASIVMLVLLLPRLGTVTLGAVLEMLRERAAEIVERVYPGHGMPALVAQPPQVPATDTIVYTGPLRYVVGFDLEQLTRHAQAAGAVIVIPRAIGEAVAPGDRLFALYGGLHRVDEAALLAAVWLARERSLDNDPAYALRLLVDIAIRALSPAVNDPTTAVGVLDDIDAILRRIGQRHVEANAVADADGVVRVIRAVPSWDDLVALALTEIHQYGRDSFQVERRLATLLRELPDVLPASRRAALDRFARWRAHTLNTAEGWLDPSAYDRQGIGRSDATIATSS